jgi:hypothetical protein
MNNNLTAFPKRKPIPQSIRFEVFKRDAFTCQYCGNKAPDVVLHVDHIKPVADGGENEIINLVTSCQGCNLGKGARPLDDDSIIAKQRAQIEELSERRAQLEMMVEWRESLQGLDALYLQEIQNWLLNYTGFTANDLGTAELRLWLRKYGHDAMLDAMTTSFNQYMRLDDKGKCTTESWTKAFNMLPKIIEVKKRGGMPDWKMRAFYARGILRRRLKYLDERQVINIIEMAVEAGVDVEEVVALAKQCRNWADFDNSLYQMMAEAEK